MGKVKNLSWYGRTFLTATFMLLASLSALAEDVTRTVTLGSAGALSTTVGDDKLKITNLTVSGSINGADILCLREMAGKDIDGNATEGKLTVLDLSGATIVKDSENCYYQMTFKNNDGNVTSVVKVGLNTADNAFGPYAFYKCSNLTSVTMPSNLTSFGNYAFSDCTGLLSITIPSSVTSIGASAFYRCTSFQSVEIPNSVKSIGNSAFGWCTNLTSVSIPSSVKTIGSTAFGWCKKLESINIPEGITSIADGTFAPCI